MLSVNEVVGKVDRLKTKYASRDQRMRSVLSVRQGDISKVYPAMFTEEYPKPLVANFIDVAARDLDRKSTRLNSSHVSESRMPSSA